MTITRLATVLYPFDPTGGSVIVVADTPPTHLQIIALAPYVESRAILARPL